jgi:hypothetical protein
MSNFRQYIARKMDEYGSKFDPSALNPEFVKYYDSGERIEVSDGEYTRRGTVGVTTGWRPSFLLMCRINSLSSSDCISGKDRVLRVIKK